MVVRVLGPLPCELINAAARGEIKRVVKWLRQGDINAQCMELAGNALLHSASVHEQIEMMRELLKRGATVNLQNHEGSTALMAASEQARFGDAAVRLLLEHKADPNLQTNIQRVTALMSAARCGHAGVVALLLRSGAEPDLHNPEHGTALHQAAGAGHMNCVQLLLDAGANTELVNRKGRTAHCVAVRRGKADVAKLLASKGKDDASSGEDSPTSVLAEGAEQVVRGARQRHVPATQQSQKPRAVHDRSQARKLLVKDLAER
tara:strand:- start:213 stop:998 length:786 start_codon:yes stop_codon:yes gene_type:complete